MSDKLTFLPSIQIAKIDPGNLPTEIIDVIKLTIDFGNGPRRTTCFFGNDEKLYLATEYSLFLGFERNAITNRIRRHGFRTEGILSRERKYTYRGLNKKSLLGKLCGDVRTKNLKEIPSPTNYERRLYL